MTPVQTHHTPPTLDARTIRELEPVLLAYARRRLRREDLAHDVVQETWLAAMKSLAESFKVHSASPSLSSMEGLSLRVTR